MVIFLAFVSKIWLVDYGNCWLIDNRNLLFNFVIVSRMDWPILTAFLFIYHLLQFQKHI